MKTYALFPGQGSQNVGMGKDFFENFSIVKETFEEASESISTNLKKLCFEGPEEELKKTENTQPCLLVTSVSIFRVMQKEKGFKPDAFAGHSLGEYSALVASGSLSLSTATRLVKERGKAMQSAVPLGEGSMAAILSLEDDLVKQLCLDVAAETKEVCEPANFNSPGQVVISGSTLSIQKAIEFCKTNELYKKGKAMQLPVSAPFHCSMMKPARERMKKLFSELSGDQKPKAPSAPYLANVTSDWVREASPIAELLEKQVDHPVLWTQSMLKLLESDFLEGYEVGPGKVLSGLMKRISSSRDQKPTVQTVFDLTQFQTIKEFV